MTDEELLGTVPQTDDTYDYEDSYNRILDSLERADKIKAWEQKYAPTETSYTQLGQVLDMLPYIVHYDEHPDFTGWGDVASNVIQASPEILKEIASEMASAYADSPLEIPYDAATGLVAGAVELAWPNNLPVMEVPLGPADLRGDDDYDYNIVLPEFPIRPALKHAKESLMKSWQTKLQDMTKNPEDYPE